MMGPKMILYENIEPLYDLLYCLFKPQQIFMYCSDNEKYDQISQWTK